MTKGDAQLLLLMVPSIDFTGFMVLLLEPLQTLSVALRMLATGGVKVAILTIYFKQFVIKFTVILQHLQLNTLFLTNFY